MNKRTTEQWQALFAEQADSGLSAAAFCKARKLCPKYFSLRRRQLSVEADIAKKTARFIQAKPSKALVTVSPIRLRYGQVELFFNQADVHIIASVAKALA